MKYTSSLWYKGWYKDLNLCLNLENATCKTIQCARGQTCLTDKLNHDLPRCVTCKHPRWCRHYRKQQLAGPICSTNGRTYNNWCEMSKDACETRIALDTEHFGICDSTEAYD